MGLSGIPYTGSPASSQFHGYLWLSRRCYHCHASLQHHKTQYQSALDQIVCALSRRPFDQKQVASSYEFFSKAFLANDLSFLTQTIEMNGSYRRFKAVGEQLQLDPTGTALFQLSILRCGRRRSQPAVKAASLQREPPYDRRDPLEFSL